MMSFRGLPLSFRFRVISVSKLSEDLVGGRDAALISTTLDARTPFIDAIYNLVVLRRAYSRIGLCIRVSEDRE